MLRKSQFNLNIAQQKQLIACLVLGSFLCQGIALLIYQVSWELAMEKIVGTALPTVAMIVSIFLLGMGLGAFLFSKVISDYRLAGRIYFVNQFLLFSLGLIFVHSNGFQFLACLTTHNIDWLPVIYLLRFSVIGFYFLLTAILIGAGFPLLLSFSIAYQINISARILYLFNLLGSAAGAVLTGFLLLPQLGTAETTIIAALIHLISGLAIIIVSFIFYTRKIFHIHKPPASSKRSLYGYFNRFFPQDSDAYAQLLAMLRRFFTNSLPASLTIHSPSLVLMAAIAVAGFFNVFIALISIRFFRLIMGSSNSAYALLSVIVLLAVACGTFLTGAIKEKLSGRKHNLYLQIISLLFFLAGILLSFALLFLAQAPVILIIGETLHQSIFHLPSTFSFILSNFLIMFSTVFAPCLCLGAILPLCFNIGEICADLSTIKPGQMYALNLFAAASGCLCGGMIIIPFLNLFSHHAIRLSFLLSVTILLLVALLIYIYTYTYGLAAWKDTPDLSPANGIHIPILSAKRLMALLATTTVVMIVILLVLTGLFPWNEAILTAGLSYLPSEDLRIISDTRQSSGKHNVFEQIKLTLLATKKIAEAVNLPILFYKEGSSSTVSLTANPKLNIICLKTDGQSESALPLNVNLPAPTSDKSTQILLGLLPTIFCRSAPNNVFLLGYGAGSTARSVLLNPEVHKLMVAELEPAVIDATKYLRPYLNQLFKLNVTASSSKPDKRLQINIIDGRCLLSMLNKHYEVIISQPGEPSRSSSAHLYTIEFWQLAKSRLQGDGVFCQWLPLYNMDCDSLISLCRSFLFVFPRSYVLKLDRSAELILLGFNDEEAAKTFPFKLRNEWKKNWKNDQKNEENNMLMQLGFANPKALFHMIYLTPASIPVWLSKYDQPKQASRLNTDNFPFVKYRLQSLLAKEGNYINRDVERMIQEKLVF